MKNCDHALIRRYYFEDTGEFADLWACAECELRFEPLKPEIAPDQSMDALASVLFDEQQKLKKPL